MCVRVCVYHVVPPCWHDMIPWPFLCLVVVVVVLKWFVIYLNFDWQIAQRCAAPGGAIWPGRDAQVAREGVSGGAPEIWKPAFWCLPHQMWQQMDRDNVAQFPTLWPYLNSNIVGCSDGWRRRMMAAWDDDDDVVDVCPTRRQSVTPAFRQGCTRPPTTWGWTIK